MMELHTSGLRCMYVWKRVKLSEAEEITLLLCFAYITASTRPEALADLARAQVQKNECN